MGSWRIKSKKKIKADIVQDEDIKQESIDKIEFEKIDLFDEYPLNKSLKNDLKKNGYLSPTKIQRFSIHHILEGKDLMAAAKTGSGKTLAFLIPMLELLWRDKWSKIDGLGSLIITPTRELAYQIFEVLRKIGKSSNFSAGLVIGGKSVEEERDAILNTNIIICTPGRLLQHMDETANFECNNLKLLILDEADKVLELGFKDTLSAIIENLPKLRQTILFSATQTKNINDLCRLSLKNPVYVNVHENSKNVTPSKLQQKYVVCNLENKVNFLFTFLKFHSHSKIIVFFSCCKEVKFYADAFSLLKCQIKIMVLHGNKSQMRRINIYDEFCRKTKAVLFATDVAARGLDFANVDWILQLDCPSNVVTYIHRVGRTARFNKSGDALLVLTPLEENKMIKNLEEKQIKLEKIETNQDKMIDIIPKLQSLCAQNGEIKLTAQRAITAYIKSIHIEKDKEIFDVKKIDWDLFAKSFGLLNIPSISSNNEEMNTNSNEKNSWNESDSEGEFLPKKITNKIIDNLPSVEKNPKDSTSQPKKTNDYSINKIKKTLVKKKIILNNKIIFDDNGQQINDGNDQVQNTIHDCNQTKQESPGIDIKKELNKMKRVDIDDRISEKKRVHQKHVKQAQRS